MRNSKLLAKKVLKTIAEFMCVAAKTAPKAKGIDNITTLIIDHDQKKKKIIQRMIEVSKKENKPGFYRDAQNIKKASIIVIIGTKISPLHISYCGICGYKNCHVLLRAKSQCAFNSIDLGIAIGSAVDTAANFHADNRIMYSVGKIAIELNMFKDKKVKLAMAIPLSATGKNIFFDRK